MHKGRLVCSHGTMQSFDVYHMCPSINGETPDKNDPWCLLVPVDISTLDILSWAKCLHCVRTACALRAHCVRTACTLHRNPPHATSV